MGLFKALRDAFNASPSASDRARLRTPHYYAFYYPEGRGPKSDWRYPKMYTGPFDTAAKAEAWIKKTRPAKAEAWIKKTRPAKAGESRKRFQVKLLTAAQFKKIWGALPQESYD